MSAPAFTPGPWELDGNSDIRVVGGNYVGSAMREEDCRLIAAAPELFRELTNAVVLLRAAGVQETANGTIRAAEAVLAKASGEQQ